jgi:ketosteroid isomerase-like protein
VRIAFPVVLAVALMLAAASARAQPAASRAEDLAAIRALINDYMAVVNDPAFAAASRDDRKAKLEPFYRPTVPAGLLHLEVESDWDPSAMPVFFGPMSEPVVSGSEQHLANTLQNFANMFQFKYRYRYTIDFQQILLDQRLATVSMVTTNIVTSPDGITQTVRGRATLVLEKMPYGAWVVGHEHIDLIPGVETPKAPGKNDDTREPEPVG